MLRLEDWKAAGDLLTIEKFASFCDTSQRTVERWLQERRIDSIKLGGALLIPKTEVIRLLSNGYRTRSME